VHLVHHEHMVEAVLAASFIRDRKTPHSRCQPIVVVHSAKHGTRDNRSTYTG
jgi:hypothetical protein